MCLLFILIPSVFFLAGCGDGGKTGHWLPGDGTAPTVSAVAPQNNAGGVAINTRITAIFSEAMDPATVDNTTFRVTGPGGTPVSGTVTPSGVNAVFTPSGDLADNTTYTATITTGAMDTGGNALASNFVWRFTTGAAADTTAPTVILTAPDNAATGVATNSAVNATFSEAMDPLTILNTTFRVTRPDNTVVSGAVTPSGVNAVFTPSGNLAANTTYTATITTGAKDLAGLALASNHVWSFTTGATADTTKPTVILTSPDNAATGVVLSKKVTATFSEAMDPLTILNTTFRVTGPGVTPVSGTVTYVGLIATFTPTSYLADNTTYTATITTGAKDSDGNALASNYVWSFTTVAAAEIGLGPQPVDLGTAENFVILAKTGTTTTGVTDITGNIGVSPAAASFITGFGLIADSTNTFSTSSLVTGRIYAADYAPPTPANMTTAISDMETAYTDAAGRTLPDFTELYAGNLSGRTLAPGLYKWSTGVSIDAATAVTLSGAANDVWIFQIAGDLTVNPGAAVTLSPGVQAKNIFWQVGGGTGVTLDTTSAFMGNILAAKAIVFKNGATLTGRALAQTNVTLIANTITLP